MLGESVGNPDSQLPWKSSEGLETLSSCSYSKTTVRVESGLHTADRACGLKALVTLITIPHSAVFTYVARLSPVVTKISSSALFSQSFLSG